jgi:hypothetical protein
MNPCYLVLISRNQWFDYGLVTDLPANFGSPELGLKKRIKNFFPLDFADKEIVFSDKLIDSAIHLQSWCGRIDSFGLEDLPYVEQIGRPIKLGIGVVQELGNDNAFIRFNLNDIKSFLLPLIQAYQREQDHEPELVELLDIGIKGDIHALAVLHRSNDSLSAGVWKPSEANAEHPALVSSAEQDLSVRLETVSLMGADSLWIDDFFRLYRFYLGVSGILNSSPLCHSSRSISRFLRATRSRTWTTLDIDALEKNWKNIYQFLLDVWRVSNVKRLEILPKIGNPFWTHPRFGNADKTKIDLLRQQLGLLEDLLDECNPLLESVEFRFGQISDLFCAILLGMLD